MRRREQMKLKIKAMSSEARASAMIIGSLPFIMFGVIYLDRPGLHDEAVHRSPRLDAPGGRHDQSGLGLGIMGKMVRFEI